jgi:hypothetical protein
MGTLTDSEHLSQKGLVPKMLHSSVKPAKRFRTWIRASCFLGESLALLVAVIEGSLHTQARPASPYLKLYQSDPELGVVMKAHQRQSWDPTGHHELIVRTNAYGFRGKEWPGTESSLRYSVRNTLEHPAVDIMVGNSHVFGYGIDEADTLSEQLGKLLKKPIYNLGVPTYGPWEYNQVLRRHISDIPPRIIWYILHPASDSYALFYPAKGRFRSPFGQLTNASFEAHGIQRILFQPWLSKSRVVDFFGVKYGLHPCFSKETKKHWWRLGLSKSITKTTIETRS